ncbi:MAG: hypothetical protein N2053_12215, partial [Chitinispirillaceae bacterium]|nr:hypothetical protein [Chitinispirillaceae bacterium]
MCIRDSGKERPALKWLREYVASHKTKVLMYRNISLCKEKCPTFFVTSDGQLYFNGNIQKKGYSVKLFNIIGRGSYSSYHTNPQIFVPFTNTNFTIIKIKDSSGKEFVEKITNIK